MVEGLPRSARRDLKRKLTFVPAGHEYREWHDPRTLARVVFFYFDPKKMPVHSEEGAANGLLAPRLFFEDTTLWDTALKLKTLIESAGSDNRLYFEALGTVLAHELVRLNAGAPRPGPQVRGGLAAWQQRTAAAYIEEHLPEQIPVTEVGLAVGFSETSSFTAAFRKTTGLTPTAYRRGLA
jgi:AraC family transcriptional regulator